MHSNGNKNPVPRNAEPGLCNVLGLVVEAFSCVVVGMQDGVSLMGIGLGQILFVKLLDLRIVMGLAQNLTLVLG